MKNHILPSHWMRPRHIDQSRKQNNEIKKQPHTKILVGRMEIKSHWNLDKYFDKQNEKFYAFCESVIELASHYRVLSSALLLLAMHYVLFWHCKMENLCENL